MNTFKVLSVNVSSRTGEQKVPVAQANLVKQTGIMGDAHAGHGHRQVSLLAQEDIDLMIAKGLSVSFGSFAENITTQGVDLASLPLGTRLHIGKTVLEVTQIGKECHRKCAIFQQAGECVMPQKGIFAKVIEGGTISAQSIGTYHIGSGNTGCV